MVNLRKNLNSMKYLFCFIVLVLIFLIFLEFDTSEKVYASWQSVFTSEDSPFYDEENQCYYISSAKQLAYASTMFDDLDKRFVLTNNIDLKDYQWNPWGDSENQFCGEFDGNGYVIYNLNLISQSESPIGFFSCTSGATVKNVNIVDVNAEIVGGSINYIGGLVGQISTGTEISEGVESEILTIIENCTVSGTIKILDSESHDEAKSFYVGGIVGGNFKESSVQIEFCQSNVEIGIEYKNVIEEYFVGGIVGCVGSKSIITRCINLADISNEIGYCRDIRLGGIVGDAGCLVSECYNYGEIVAGNDKNFTLAYAGGIAGVANEISNCGNLGNIFAYAETMIQTYEGVDNYPVDKIYNINKASVYYGRTVDKVVYTTPAYAGGICGFVNKVSNCYNSANIFGGNVFTYYKVIESFVAIAPMINIMENYSNSVKIYDECYTGNICGVVKESLEECYYDQDSIVSSKEHEDCEYTTPQNFEQFSYNLYLVNPYENIYAKMYGLNINLIFSKSNLDDHVVSRTWVSGNIYGEIYVLNHDYTPHVDGEKNENNILDSLGELWNQSEFINNNKPYVKTLYW